MIVVEGPDGSGKTTLAHRLAQLRGLRYEHAGPPEEGIDHVRWYLDRTGPYVWDRFHLGEETYGACGFSRRGTWAERERVREHLRSVGAMVIVLHASRFEDLRTDGRQEMYGDIQRRAVSDRYNDIVRTRPDWYSKAIDISLHGFPSDDLVCELTVLHAQLIAEIAR